MLECPNEKALTQAIVNVARDLGWLHYHTWRSIHSPAGFPDLVLVKPPRLIFAELKMPGKKTTPAQVLWLQTLQMVEGIEVYTWYPYNYDEAVKILAEGSA